jgi:type IV secretory pathway TrbF-like protein
VEPADSISRLGFSRWYERRLIEAHAWFVSGFICMILVATCMEELTYRGSAARLLAYVCLVAVALVICIYGMFRYQRILWEAESVGERATCPSCNFYARFRLISPTAVRCRKCDHEWQLIP